jgi:uncharacterized DUF497 family protein
MIFEWDETKRLSNINKHGIDFLDADLLFSGPVIEWSANRDYGEHRRLVTGMIDAMTVTAVFTRRGNAIRLISIRRARDGEKARYHAVYQRGPGGPPG